MSQPQDESAPEAVGSLKRKSGAGSIVAAVVLGFLSFLSLLSTGCFGLFALASRRDRIDGLFFFGMLVMAAVTFGFFMWCRAVLRRARPDNVVPHPTVEQTEFKRGRDQ
jgi:hypothetical protein